jgi:hypothetical protein
MSLLDFVQSSGFKWLCFLLLVVIAVSAAVSTAIYVKHIRPVRQRMDRNGKRFMRQYKAYRAGIGGKEIDQR